MYTFELSDDDRGVLITLGEDTGWTGLAEHFLHFLRAAGFGVDREDLEEFYRGEFVPCGRGQSHPADLDEVDAEEIGMDCIR